MSDDAAAKNPQLSVDSEKVDIAAPVDVNTPQEEEKHTHRAVAFPDEQDVHETERIRPRGPEMKRELTQEDRELAQAGYDEAKLNKEKAEFENVDIQEHRLAFAELGAALESTFDHKDPGSSSGLTSEEVKTRIARDGLNILTPPKKKSAWRKVCTF